MVDLLVYLTQGLQAIQQSLHPYFDVPMLRRVVSLYCSAVSANDLCSWLMPTGVDDCTEQELTWNMRRSHI